MLVLTLFTLGNSTDAFLLLKLTDAAGGAQYVPLMWAALHVVKATVSMRRRRWSDRIGRRAVIAIGWLVYAAVYAGFAISTSLPRSCRWFLVYGFYFGFAEGTEKALVADLAPASRRGFAFGVYNAVQGLGSLAASVVFGVSGQRRSCGRVRRRRRARARCDGAAVRRRAWRRSVRLLRHDLRSVGLQADRDPSDIID